MIRRTLEDTTATVSSPNIHKRYIDLPKVVKEVYDAIQLHSIYQDKFTVVSEGGAGKLSKLHQLAQGSVITEDETAVNLTDFKARHIADLHQGQKVAIFYRYVADKTQLLKYFQKEDLYQIDSAITGIDLSHYDAMVVMSLTFSGANYAQMLSRMLHPNSTTQPDVYIYLTRNTVDEVVYKTVSEKHDFNSKFLRS